MRLAACLTGVMAICGLATACKEVSDPPRRGAILFDVAAVPPGITRVVGRIDSDSVVLDSVPTVSQGYAARGVMLVSPGTYSATVDAYASATKRYTGQTSVTVGSGDTALAIVLLVCVETGCDGGALVMFSFFPTGESEPNDQASTCDTTSWTHILDFPHPAGITAPYAYGGNGRLSSASDVDYWCSTLGFSGGDSVIAFTITPAGSGVDPVLSLLNSSGTVVATNDNGGGQNPVDAKSAYRVPSTGSYALKVSAASAPTGVGRYTTFMYVGRPAAMPQRAPGTESRHVR